MGDPAMKDGGAVAPKEKEKKENRKTKRVFLDRPLKVVMGSIGSRCAMNLKQGIFR